MEPEIVILVKHQMLLSRHMAACAEPQCDWYARRAPEDTALNRNSPVMAAFAEHIRERLEEIGFGDAHTAWDQGVTYGHNQEGRLIDKRVANPYPRGNR